MHRFFLRGFSLTQTLQILTWCGNSELWSALVILQWATDITQTRHDPLWIHLDLSDLALRTRTRSPLLRPTYLQFQGNQLIFFLNRIISGTYSLQPQQEVWELLVERGMLCLKEAAWHCWEANSFLLCKITRPAASPSSSDKAPPKSPHSPAALFGLKPTGMLSCITKNCQYLLLLGLLFAFFFFF